MERYPVEAAIASGPAAGHAAGLGVGRRGQLFRATTGAVPRTESWSAALRRSNGTRIDFPSIERYFPLGPSFQEAKRPPASRMPLSVTHKLAPTSAATAIHMVANPAAARSNTSPLVASARIMF